MMDKEKYSNKNCIFDLLLMFSSPFFCFFTEWNSTGLSRRGSRSQQTETIPWSAVYAYVREGARTTGRNGTRFWSQVSRQNRLPVFLFRRVVVFGRGSRGVTCLSWRDKQQQQKAHCLQSCQQCNVLPTSEHCKNKTKILKAILHLDFNALMLML